MARVPVGIALEVVLVLGFGLPEGTGRRDFGNDLAGPDPRGVDVGNRVLGNRSLLVGREEDGRPVAGADVVPLPVLRRRIMIICGPVDPIVSRTLEITRVYELFEIEEVPAAG